MGLCVVAAGFTRPAAPLDHLPDPAPALKEMARLATKRLVLVELTLPDFGSVDDPRCVPFSYSHDYEKLFADLGIRLLKRTRTPCGEDISEHYTTYELLPE